MTQGRYYAGMLAQVGVLILMPNCTPVQVEPHFCGLSRDYGSRFVALILYSVERLSIPCPQVGYKH